MKKIYGYFIYFVVLVNIAFVNPLIAAEAGKDRNPSKIFHEKGYGYTINYPQDWAYVKQSPHIIVFTKKEGIDANMPAVGIQNLFSTMVKDGRYKDVGAVLADFENQLKATNRAAVYPTEGYTYSVRGSSLAGKQFVAEYVLKDKSYKQWVVVIPRKSGEVFHVWIYSAPAELFDKYLAVAKTMLDSWMLTD